MKARQSCLKGANYRAVDVGPEAVLKAEVSRGEACREFPIQHSQHAGAPHLPLLPSSLHGSPQPPPDFAAKGDVHVDMYVGAYVSLSADSLLGASFSSHPLSPPPSTFSSSSLHWQERQALLSQP